MTPREAKSFLASFVNYELKPAMPYRTSLRLDRVYHLLALIGDPQKYFAAVHVAGSKGKGSTCALTAYILQHAGFKVGLYTSPHLTTDRERIRILDKKNFNSKDPFCGMISEKDFCVHLQKIKPAITNVIRDRRYQRITYFEIYTALAFSYFKEKGIDIAVLETGMGGRLDATNTVDSLVCAITPISLEHTKQLGSTVSAISTEKAAIIKNKNQSVVIAPQESQALKVIMARCRKFNLKPVIVGSDIRSKVISSDIRKQFVTIRTKDNVYSRLKMNLLGRHQAGNTAVSVGIIEALRAKGFMIPDKAIRNGIERALWPGRFEVIRKDPLVIIDGAHNPAAMETLVKSLKEILRKKNLTVILGVSNDKDVRGICRALEPIVKQIIFTRSRNPRAFDFKTLDVKSIFEKRAMTYSQNISQAMQKALRLTAKKDAVLVTGSLFIAAEARKLCKRYD